jgi:hypothetical protein
MAAVQSARRKGFLRALLFSDSALRPYWVYFRQFSTNAGDFAAIMLDNAPGHEQTCAP